MLKMAWNGISHWPKGTKYYATLINTHRKHTETLSFASWKSVVNNKLLVHSWLVGLVNSAGSMIVAQLGIDFPGSMVVAQLGNQTWTIPKPLGLFKNAVYRSPFD